MNALYGTDVYLWSLCTSGPKVFVAGDFVKAGMIFLVTPVGGNCCQGNTNTPLGYALWNGTEWTYPVLKGFSGGSYDNFENIVCGTSGQVIWVVYMTSSNTSLVLNRINSDLSITPVSSKFPRKFFKNSSKTLNLWVFRIFYAIRKSVTYKPRELPIIRYRSNFHGIKMDGNLSE